ncbi:GAF domain-containing protein [bacterium]|nr:GAF domain-containing protein [bacterium]NCT20332.1 GAF domain-containing protein [bacterium]
MTDFIAAQKSWKRQAENVALIARTGMAAAWVSALMFGAGAFQNGGWQFIGLAINGLALATGLTIAFLLNRQKRSASAVWLTGIMLGITFIAVNFFVQGVGIVIAVIGMLIYINIALQTLDPGPAVGMFLLGLVAMIAAVFIDQNNIITERLIAPLWVEQTIIVMGGVVFLTLTINLIQQTEFKNLRTKITLAFLIVALVPLWTASIPQFISVRQTLAENSNDLLTQNADDAAEEMDSLLNSLQQQVQVGSEIPVLQKYLTGDTARSAEVLDTLKILNKHNEFIVSSGLIGAQGITLLDTQAYRVNQSNADSGWFRQTMVLRAVYVSEVLYDESILRPVLIVAAPIFNDNQKVIGLARFIYDAQILQNELERQNAWLEDSQTAILLDQNNIILGHNTLPALQFKTLIRLRDEQVTSLQQSRQLPPGEAESFSAELTTLAKDLQNPTRGNFFQTSLDPNTPSNQYATIAPLQTKNWNIIFARTGSAFSGQVRTLANTVLLISTLLMVAVIAAAGVSANLITSPLNTLAAQATEIGKGNLKTSTKTERRDEIGALANVVDDTAHKLQTALQEMEQRVNTRTAALAQANLENSRRASQFRALANVARAVTNLQDLERLLPQVTETISESFGYYHAGIFLLDASGTLAILRAANSEGGKKMLTRGHQLKVGQVGIVGYVTATGSARIALDVGEDAAFFNNPDLPETRSEMALPLKVGDEVIGALDVQSREANAFSTQDSDVLGLLAEQIAIAIHNARLYEDTQKALTEAQLIFGQHQQGSWQAIARNQALSFRYYNGQVEALHREDILATPDESVLQLPISVRGESLGSVQIHIPQQKRDWTQEEIRLYQTITERLAYALENARLFQDAQRLASKERVIGGISTRISASINLDNILQTTVQELSHAIPDSEITIQIKTEDNESAS